MQATTPVDRLDHAAARQSGDKGKTKSLKREDLKDSWLDPSPRRTARHARLSSRLSLQPKQTGILLTTAPGTGSVPPRLATVLRDTVNSLVCQFLFVPRSNLRFSCLIVQRVINVVSARGITDMLDMNEVSANFCTRERRIRPGEAENPAPRVATARAIPTKIFDIVRFLH